MIELNVKRLDWLWLKHARRELADLSSERCKRIWNDIVVDCDHITQELLERFEIAHDSIVVFNNGDLGYCDWTHHAKNTVMITHIYHDSSYGVLPRLYTEIEKIIAASDLLEWVEEKLKNELEQKQ